MLEIFITHADEDYELVKKFKSALEKYGNKKFKTRIGKDIPEHIKFFPNKFADLIDNCDIFIPLITDRAYKDNKIWVQQEIGYAFSCKRKLGIDFIPIVEKRDTIDKGFFNKQTDITFSLSDKRFQKIPETLERWDKLFQEVVEHMLDNIPEPFNLELRNILPKPITDAQRLIIQGFIENQRKRPQYDLSFGIILDDDVLVRMKGDNWLYDELPSVPKRLQESIKDQAIIFKTTIEKISSFDFWSMAIVIDIASTFEWEWRALPIGIYLVSNGEIYLWNPFIIMDDDNYTFDNSNPKLLNLGDKISIKPVHKMEIIGKLESIKSKSLT